MVGMKQYYNIIISNIYHCNTIQYGLKEISIYCALQYIVIYCNVCCLNVINTQSLHHKIDWTWIIHFSFSSFFMVIQGVYSLLYCQNSYSHMKNPIKYCNNYGNILEYTQTQYAIWHWLVLFHPYCMAQIFVVHFCIMYVITKKIIFTKFFCIVNWY